jgi:hypothetical protein
MVVHYFKHPLDGCRERARRADGHLAELEREIVLVFNKQAHIASFKLDPKPPHRVVDEALPAETFAGVRLGTLIGEACYNLRCALDYLVYAVATLDAGSPQKKSQPYAGCNWTKRLRDISNMDKHRHLVLSRGNTQITIHSSLEKDLAGIWGVKRSAIHPLTGKAVDVKVHVFGQITLDDGTPVIETIKEIKTGVADTLRQFEPDF